MIIAILVLAVIVIIGTLVISVNLVDAEKHVALFSLDGSPVTKARNALAVVFLVAVVIVILAIVELVSGHL